MSFFSNTGAGFGEVKLQIDTLAADPAAKIGLRIAFLALGVEFLVLALSWSRLPPEVPLWYSRPYGESQLTGAWWLWLLPGGGLFINLVSIRWAGVVVATEKLLAQILVWVGAMTAVMGLAAVSKIVALML